MPSQHQVSGLKPSKRHTKACKIHRSADVQQGTTQAAPLRPRLPSGEESMLDFARKLVNKRFPSFVPRDSLDIITMAAPGYDGPTDQLSICAYVDAQRLPHAMDSDVIRSNYVDVTVGRMRATEVIGIKPRPGQKFWVRVMPSWPEYSIRLWESSSGMRIFGMDLIESAAGTPVNLSHRFALHGTNILGAYLPIKPFVFAPELVYSPPPGPGEELYYLREEQTVIVQDMLQPTAEELQTRQGQGQGSEEVLVSALKFRVPAHPVPVTGPPPGVKYDEVHWCLDE